MEKLAEKGRKSRTEFKTFNFVAKDGVAAGVLKNEEWENCLAGKIKRAVTLVML